MRLLFEAGERVYVDGHHVGGPCEPGLVMEANDPEATSVKVYVLPKGPIKLILNERVYRDRRKVERRRVDREGLRA